MFTQKCFIRKNSKELQDKVYILGGRSGTCLWNSEFNTLLAVRHDSFRCYDDEWGNADSLIEGCYIDCGTNEELFLALAALRDDTDKNQWFVDYSTGVNGGSWYLSGLDNIHDCFQSTKECHKATVEELIERFSK